MSGANDDLSNATLSSLQLVSGAGPTGLPAYAAAVDLGAARVVLAAVSFSQKWVLGAVLGTATAVIYVPADVLPAGARPDKGALLVAALDEDPAGALTYELTYVRPWAMDGISYFECFGMVPAAS